MRTYETIFIVHPEVGGDAYQGIVEKFKTILADQGAVMLKVDEWGTRKLAYPIKKQNRGTYVYCVYDAKPEVIAEFERRLRIDEAVIRFQTVQLENGFEVAAEAAQTASGSAGGEEAEESEETEEE